MTNGFMSVKTDDVDLATLENDPDSVTHVQDPNDKKVTNGHNWEKRYSDQQKYVTQLQNDISTLRQELSDLKKKPLALPTTVEELEKFKKDHPGLANSIISLARLEVSERDKELSERIKEIDEKTAAVDAAAKLETVLKVHPDAKKIKASQEFADWYTEQSGGTQELFKSSDPKDWIRGINIYKQDLGIKSSKSKKEEAALQPNQKSSPDTKTEADRKVWKASEINRMSDNDYKLNRDKILKAKTEGRYIYDLPK